MTPKKILSLFFGIILGLLLIFAASAIAENAIEIFTLKSTIENAITASIDLKVSREETKAARYAQKIQRSNFLPTFVANYSYKRNDEEIFNQSLGLIRPQNEYAFSATFRQPVFTGFSLLNKYKIASLGLDATKINEKLNRQRIILQAKIFYFSLLKGQKIASIAKETVIQIAAQKEVAKNFYQVGMTPLNDLLEAQVELANAKQNLIIAENNLDIARSNFNTLLRRPIHSTVEVKDILDYSTFEKDIDNCLASAQKNRLEISIAALNIEIAEKELKLAQKNYYPTLTLQGMYAQEGTDWDAKGGLGVLSDSSQWYIMALASWDFWQWGKTAYGIKEKLSHLSQARYQKTAILDYINLEVKQAYLKTKESEKNILTVQKAIDQAKENFRINKERYKEQVATSTDVLDAQTLLSRTMTNYYNALYDFKISKASLFRAMGLELME